MVNIANPIYDSVFKYLMEDERIAKTLISALLKKEVVEVDMRRNEYTNGSRDNISMFASISERESKRTMAPPDSSSSNCRKPGLKRKPYASANTSEHNMPILKTSSRMAKTMDMVSP